MAVTGAVENIGSEITIQLANLFDFLTSSNDLTVLFLVSTTILALYCYVVLLSYRKLSKRDMFEVHLEDKHGLGKVFEVFVYIVKYIILFPVYTVFWFIFLSYAIILLGAPDFAHILFVAALILAATRLLAYFSEASSGEIAKLLPFVFLSSVLLNPAVIGQEYNFPDEQTIRDELVPAVVDYFKIIFVLEIVLRILFDLSLLIKPAMPAVPEMFIYRKEQKPEKPKEEKQKRNL